MTKGRGRNDRYSDTYKTRKAIFLYPLVTDFRERLCVDVSTYTPITPYYQNQVEVTDNLDSDEWAQFEFGNCQLGHASRTKRVIKISTDMAKEPAASYISATKGKKSDIDSYYRFLEND